MTLSDAECIYNTRISLFPCLETYQLFCLDKDVHAQVQDLLLSHIMDPRDPTNLHWEE